DDTIIIANNKFIGLHYGDHKSGVKKISGKSSEPPNSNRNFKYCFPAVLNTGHGEVRDDMGIPVHQSLTDDHTTGVKESSVAILTLNASLVNSVVFQCSFLCRVVGKAVPKTHCKLEQATSLLLEIQLYFSIQGPSGPS
ncbi:hypothetical protein STEG23_015290, partial [Scotinomys teguina]